MIAKPWILVVDDDKDIRETLVEVLGERGYHAIGAADGVEALAQLRDPPSARWSVVFLDLMMPIMDGRAFRAEQLRDPELSKIPVVVVSATNDVGQVAAEMRADLYMTKPMRLAQLMRAVEQFCRAAA